MKKRLECEVFGRVQFVMYRDFIKRNARSLGLVGTVKNNTNGTVSICAEGDESNLHKLITVANKGSLFARVNHTTEAWNTPLGEFKSFDILYE